MSSAGPYREPKSPPPPNAIDLHLSLPVQLRQERRWARLAELQTWHNAHGTRYADAVERYDAAVEGDAA